MSARNLHAHVHKEDTDVAHRPRVHLQETIALLGSNVHKEDTDVAHRPRVHLQETIALLGSNELWITTGVGSHD